MNETEHDNLLHADEARLAELHVRDLLGDDLADDERAELAVAREKAPALFDDLAAAHHSLEAAAQSTAAPRADFAARVMADVQASENRAAPRPLHSDGSGVMTAYTAPATRPRRWGWAAVASAALVLLGVGVSWQAGRMGPGVSTPAPESDTAQLRLHKGGLLDHEGRAVEAQNLEAGHLYRVRAGDEVVLQTRRAGALRLLENAEFQAPDAHGDSDLNLKNGTVFAHSDGTEGAPVVVDAPSMRTAVEGVSMVMQEPLPANPDEEAAGMGQCIVVVIRGVAHVDTQHAQPVMVRQDEVLISGMTPESVRIFMNKVKERAQALESLPADPDALRRQRKTYRERVNDYTQQLTQLEHAIKDCTDDVRLAELQDRRERVRVYLHQHRDRLASFHSGDKLDESPLRRARRMRRAAEQIEQNQQTYLEPERWM